MPRLYRISFVACFSAAILASGCGASPTSPERGPFQFTVAPMRLDEHARIWQMGYDATGSLQPWIQFERGSSPVTEEWLAVAAPAAGTVTAVASTRLNGIRVEFAAADGYRFYLNGLETSTVAPGQTVRAGDRIGTRVRFNRGGLGGVGLGVINPQLSGLFANPLRYPDEIRFADSPLRFYEEPLRTALREVVRPAGADPAVSYDVPGRLQGVWYLPSAPLQTSLSFEDHANRLLFFYTWREPFSGRTLRVQWTAPNTGSWGGTPIGPDPRDVGVSSGLVRYDIALGPRMVLLVQMTSDSSLRFEAFDAYYTPNPAGFTGSAITFVR